MLSESCSSRFTGWMMREDGLLAALDLAWLSRSVRYVSTEGRFRLLIAQGADSWWRSGFRSLRVVRGAWIGWRLLPPGRKRKRRKVTEGSVKGRRSISVESRAAPFDRLRAGSRYSRQDAGTTQDLHISYTWKFWKAGNSEALARFQ